MPKQVLDVGNCEHDHFVLSTFLTGHFDCRVVQAHRLDDALSQLRTDDFDLVLINRQLDCDASEGLKVIQEIKAEPALASIPCMLVTNFAEYQQAAVELGAERGFGKREYDHPETIQKLGRILA